MGMKYKIKYGDIVVDQEGESIEDAIQEYHDKNICHINYNGFGSSVIVESGEMENNHKETWHFWIAYVEGDLFISRIVTQGIYRKGVIAKDKRDRAAKKLGISVEEIKHNKWEHEEFNWE
jgi:hypothetical protein